MIKLGDLVWSITGDSTQINKAVADSEKKANSLGAKFQKVAGVISKAFLIAGAAVAGIGIASIKAASDAEETGNKFNVVFRDVKKEADLVAASLSKNYGLSSKASQQLLSDTGDLLAGFKFTQKESLNVSKRINELAVDLASFTNYQGGAAGASQALTKALLGERESIKSLGIAITEADIKRLAEDKGIVGELDRQTKAMLTLELAISQSQNAIGDFQRSQNSFANQSRITISRLEDLQVIIGTVLLPVITDIVSEFGDMLQVMRENENLMSGLESILGIVSLGFQGLFSVLKLGIDIVTALISGFGFLSNAITGAADETFQLNYAFNEQSSFASKLVNEYKKLKEQQKDGADVGNELYTVVDELNKLWPESIDLVDGAATSYEDLAKAVEKARIKEQIKLTQDLAAIELQRLREAERVNKEAKGAAEEFSKTLNGLLSQEEKNDRIRSVSYLERQRRIAETRKEYYALSQVLSDNDVETLAFLNIQESLKIAQDDSLLSTLRLTQAQGASEQQIEESKQKLAEYQKTLEDLAVQETGQIEIIETQNEKRIKRKKIIEDETEAVKDWNALWKENLDDQIEDIEKLAQKAKAAEERKRAEIERTRRAQKQAFDFIAGAALSFNDNLFELRKDGLDKESAEYKKAALQQFNINKGIAAVNAAISGIEATQKIYASVPPPWGIPAAIAMGLLTAANVGTILAKKPPAFENSGIVPGSSYRGDNELARVNSGEMIINREDQAALFDIIKNKDSRSGNEIPIMIQVLLPDLTDITAETVKKINNREYLIDSRAISEDL